MNKEKISQLERIKIFLNEYYFGYGIYFTLLRIIGGPIILIMGLNIYINGNTKFGIGYSGFMIIFGIYYLIKPFIIILTQKAWFKNFDLDYEIESDKIIIQSDKSKSELDYSELKSVKQRKTYYVLKTNSNQGIYLPIKFLDSNEIDIMNKLKKTTANNVYN